MAKWLFVPYKWPNDYLFPINGQMIWCKSTKFFKTYSLKPEGFSIKTFFVCHGKEGGGALFERVSLTINSNQWEAMLLLEKIKLFY